MLQLIPSTVFCLYVFSIIAFLLKLFGHIPLNNSYAWSKSIILAVVYNSIISILCGDGKALALTNYFPVLFITYISVCILFSNHCYDEERKVIESDDSSIFIVNAFVVILLIIHIFFIIYDVYNNYHLLNI